MGRPLYTWLGSTATRSATAGSAFCTSYLGPGANGNKISDFHIQVQVATAASFNVVVEDTNGNYGLASGGSALISQLHVDFVATTLTAGVQYNFTHKALYDTKVNVIFGGSVSVNQLIIEEITTPTF